MGDWHCAILPFSTAFVLLRLYRGDDPLTEGRTDIIVPRAALPALREALGMPLDEPTPEA